MEDWVMKFKKLKLEVLVLMFCAACLAILGFVPKAYAKNPDTATAQEWRVLVVNIDPDVKYLGRTMKASKYFGFDSENSVKSLKNSIEKGSNGVVKVKIVDTVNINEFPKYTGYASMTEDTFFKVFPTPESYGGWVDRNKENHYIAEELDSDFVFDYDYLVKKAKLAERRNKGEFDAVWVFSIDPSSMWESVTVGNTIIPTNGDFVSADCESFLLLGMTYSRPEGALESVGHAFEHMLNLAFENTTTTLVPYGNKMEFASLDDLNMWEKFRYCKVGGSKGNNVYGAGMVHYSPNSDSDYDWENATPVKSYYKDFINNYPNIGETVTDFSPYSTYLPANDSMTAHHEWWLSLMPHFTGRDAQGYSNNWWDYLCAYDCTKGLYFTDYSEQKSVNMEADEVLDLNGLKLKVITVKGKEKTITAGDTSWSCVEGSKFIGINGNRIKLKKLGTVKLLLQYDGYSLELVIKSECAHDYKTVKTKNGYAEMKCSICGEKAYFLSETTDRKIGSTIKFGQFEQDNKKANGAEAIEWIIVDKTKDSYILVSKYCLDARPYNDTFDIVSWKNSTLCKWLNGDFYKSAFSDEEKKIIEDRAENTVTLLTVTEAAKYFKNNSDRQAKATAYAIKRGAWNSDGLCCWWMRGGNSELAPIDDYTGEIFSDGNGVSMKDDCVRPVISVKYVKAADATKNITLDTIKLKKGKSYDLSKLVKKGTGFTVSDKKLATVSKKGVVKAKKAGTVTIKFKTKDGKNYTVKVKVTK